MSAIEASSRRPRLLGLTPPLRGVRSGGRGALLVVSLSCALGVLLQAYVGYEGRVTGNPPSVLFWAGLAVMYGTVAYIVVSGKGLDRSGYAAAIVLLSLGMQLTRLVLYPSLFAYHDELIHVRVLSDILSTKHLYTPNSALPVTPRYPGLEIASAGIARITGLSAHASGSLLLLIARLILSLALFLVVERLTTSPRAAAIASLLYIANPQYLWFNSQFSYQSLALPLCFAFVYLVRRLEGVRAAIAWPCLLGGALAISVTHHLTALGLVALLFLWWILCFYTKGRPRHLTAALVTTIATTLLWGFFARHTIVHYVVEITQNNVKSVQQLVSGQSNHVFFKDTAGDQTPVWERYASLASVILIIVLLPLALWASRAWLRTKRAPALVLCGVAAAYPLIPLGHLTDATSEVADRSSGFIFVGIAFLFAWWAFGAPRAFDRAAAGSAIRKVGARAVACAAMLVLFVGGTVVGSGPPWLRAPGKYLVSADNRSVDPLSVAAASWMGQHLPRDQRLYGDRTGELLASALGKQHPLTNLADKVDNGALSRLLLAPPSPTDVTTAKQDRLQYLLVDRRIATDLPHVAIYTDTGEYGSEHRTRPPTKAAVTKFDSVPGADRIYDNGSLSIYNLVGLR